MITADEASALSGASFKNGLEGTLSGGARTCTYGSETKNVFYIEVAQAKDVAEAKADQAEFLALMNQNLQEAASGGLTPTQIPDFADGAVSGVFNGSPIGVQGSVFGFRKGTVFFGFSDLVLGGKAPTPDTMKSQATQVLGRLP